MVGNIVRALRLPFITASILPFIFGSLINRKDFNLPAFFLGLLAVAATHLSANLINDYADSRSGADWKDKNFYGFFGGSKLIQEKVFPESFYLKAAVICIVISFVGLIALAVILKSLFVIGIYILILTLSWQYSAKPLQFSYHRLGELFLFFLFGPALVMGGYYIQTGIFPDFKSFLLSAPFGLLTTAILVANEIPDFLEDRLSVKNTWVSITGQKNAFLLYLSLSLAAYLIIVLCVTRGYIRPLALFSLVLILPALKAASILKKYYSNKSKLVESSKLAIGSQAIASIILILAALK